MQQEVAAEPAVIPSRSVRKVSWHRGCCPACRLSLTDEVDNFTLIACDEIDQRACIFVNL